MKDAVPVVALQKCNVRNCTIICSFSPVPHVEIETVISSSATIELLQLMLKMNLRFSAIELAEVLNVIVGELSFSVMVIVTDWVPSSVADPPETEDIDTTAVSLPS